MRRDTNAATKNAGEATRPRTERAVDKSVEDTFPASDPPALHSSALPPPEAKGVPKGKDATRKDCCGTPHDARSNRTRSAAVGDENPGAADEPMAD